VKSPFRSPFIVVCPLPVPLPVHYLPSITCPAAALTGRATKLVLYVEDNVSDARLAAEALSEVGCSARLEVVENAVQAFGFLAGRGRYVGESVSDLILLPIICGHLALSVIRGHEHWKRIPVHVFSSRCSALERLQLRVARLRPSAAKDGLRKGRGRLDPPQQKSEPNSRW